MSDKKENPAELAAAKMMQPPDCWQPTNWKNRNRNRAIRLLEMALDLLTEDGPVPYPPGPPWPTPMHDKENADGNTLRKPDPTPDEDQNDDGLRTRPTHVHLGKESDWA